MPVAGDHTDPKVSICPWTTCIGKDFTIGPVHWQSTEIMDSQASSITAI